MVESNAIQALLTLLHHDPVEAAETYRRLQQRLVRYFSLTAASDPQQLTDETIARLARRVAEDASGNEPETVLAEEPQTIGSTLADLAFRTAREVLQEDLNRAQPDDQEVREWFAHTINAPDIKRDRRLATLRSCLSRLSPERRQLLESYYGWRSGRKAEHHLQLAQTLGLSTEALRNRVLRSRVQLESCVRRKHADSRHSRTKDRKA